MDRYTLNHLRQWAEHQERPEDVDDIIDKITAFVSEYPDLLERNQSWPEILCLIERLS